MALTNIAIDQIYMETFESVYETFPNMSVGPIVLFNSKSKEISFLRDAYWVIEVFHFSGSIAVHGEYRMYLAKLLDGTYSIIVHEVYRTFDDEDRATRIEEKLSIDTFCQFVGIEKSKLKFTQEDIDNMLEDELKTNRLQLYHVERIREVITINNRDEIPYALLDAISRSRLGTGVYSSSQFCELAISKTNELIEKLASIPTDELCLNERDKLKEKGIYQNIPLNEDGTVKTITDA